MKRSLILSGLLFTFLVGRTQTLTDENLKQINSFYEYGVLLLQKNKLFEANAEFEKIIRLNPNHKDALYHLAIISEKLEDSPSAIQFLLRGVKLNDKKASKYIVDKFHYTLSYADTMQNIDISTQEKYLDLRNVQVSSFSDLVTKILSKTPNKREQLQILLLWFYNNMKADSIRFFQGGNPLSNSEAFAKRIGLCDEYSNIMAQFCKAANIPNYKVEGYVKHPNFNLGDTFTEANHAWNAVYLDSSWILCDLFWSTVALQTDKFSQPRFMKRLETKYFLGLPTDFINDHLPSDPIFQFSNYPIAFSSFTKSMDGIDTTVPKMKYLNYTDSLTLFSKMNDNDRLLKISQHTFEYNKDNPNDMIVECYNYAADILNKKTATRQELINAKKSLTTALSIIDLSKDENVKTLKGNCTTSVTIIDKRLLSVK